MMLIRKEDHKVLSTDLKESSVISNLMDDFPPICKQDPLEVRVMYMKEYFEMTGQTIKISDIPDEMYGGALPIAKSRKSQKRKMTKAEYLEVTPEQVAKKAKMSKATASQPNPTASDVLIFQQEAQELDASEVLDKENRSKKPVDYVNVIEIDSDTSSSYQSSNSSELDDTTLSLIYKISKTAQKATKSVPKKIDLVNQQPPKPSHQTNPEPSSTQTHTPTQQLTIPEPVIEIVVTESVLVIKFEPSVSIPVSEPTQNLPLSTNDQPSSSSSSSSIEILEQPPTNNLLESEFIESELLKISKDMQDLVQLRTVPTLSVDYEDQWASLRNMASKLLNVVGHQCIRIQAVELKCHLRALHLAAKAKAPLLYLANAPFYPESDYLSREAKVLKLLKQKVMKQEEESKAREDFLLQRHLALEETIKQQAEVIKK